jgi:xyloglucan-specific exo-beta-1,4-glucanase
MALKRIWAGLAAGLLLSLGAAAENYKWDNVPIGGGGFISGIVTSKSERGVVYVRTDIGGAYRYDSIAGRWVALNDWISENSKGMFGVESLAVDPRNAGKVYMLAGTEYFNGGQTAILRSSDYGKTFSTTDVTAQFKTHANGMGRGTGERLQVDPGSGNVLYVGTRHNGLFKSIDSGATWSRLNGLNVNDTPNGVGISFVLLDPASVTQGTAKRIYVGVSRYGSVGPNLYLSKDGGATFAPVAGAPAGLIPQRAALTSKGRLYLTYGNGAAPHNGSASEPLDKGAIWEYNTVGGTWVNVTPAGITQAFGGISVDPSNPKRLVATTVNTWWWQRREPDTGGGDRIFTSLDAGRSWTDLMERGMTTDPDGISWIAPHGIHWSSSVEFDPFDPKTAWVVSGNGLFKTSDIDAPRSSWKFDVRGIEETAVFAVESLPNGKLMSVVGDVDGFIHDAPDQYGPQHFPRMGTTTGLAIAPQAQDVMARVGDKLYTSTNMGASWVQAPSIMAAKGNLALSADGAVLLHSPENKNITYRSTNAGGSWTAVTGLAVNNARPVADPVNPAKFYVYDRDTGKLLVSTDGGASFSAAAQLAGGGSPILRATPGVEGELWACLHAGGLSRSTNSGATFTKVGTIGSCETLGLGKAAPGASHPTLYMWGAVSAGRGLLRSIDQGASWERINDDAHQYGGPVMGWINGDMNTYGTVYMSTAGRGVAYGKIDPAGDVVVAPQVYVPPPKTAECKYVLTEFIWWGGGAADVQITNKGSSVINGWTVNWTYDDDTQVNDIYGGKISGSKPSYSATPDGNGDIQPGQTVSFRVLFGQFAEKPGPVPLVFGDICDTQPKPVPPPLYPSYNTTPVAPDASGMSSDAVQLAAKIKMGTNIGNTMEAYGCIPASETCWGNPEVSAAYIKVVKDAGFDAIRIPVSWDQYADQATGKISEAWLDRVKQVVQMTVDNGLYAIVNIHWDGGWLERNVNFASKVPVNAKQKAYWEQIATKLRDFDEHLIFASANEPDAIFPDQVSVLDSYHQTFVNAVRSTGGRNAYRVLVVQGLRTDIDMTFKDWNHMPADTVPGRQMAEIHYYPGAFSNHGEDNEWSQMHCYWGDGYKSLTDTYRNSPGKLPLMEEAYTDAQFEKMKTQFVDKGVPVVLGEFAAMKRNSTVCADMDLHLASREHFFEVVTRSALAHGILPFAWEVGVAEGLVFDRKTPAVGDTQVVDAMLVGAGKLLGLSNRPHSWNVSSDATDIDSSAYMQLAINKEGAAATYNFASPVNWSGATLKVVLNFDQAFVTDRNGGMEGLFQFFTFSDGWTASEWNCWTGYKTLVAGQDTEFTCSAFGIPNAVGLGIQFFAKTGSVTIKRANIKLAQ